MTWFLYDDRLGPKYFETKEERDAAFNAAPYIDQKHWYLGRKGDPVLRAYPE